jgi:hypothetical protein
MEIFEMIGREMKRQHWSKAQLAKILRNHPSTINGLLSNSTIQVPRLLELSEVFQYNFFREIAVSLPYKEPDYEIKTDEDTIKAPLQEEIKKLQMEVNNLQIEVNILRQTLKDVVSK